MSVPGEVPRVVLLTPFYGQVPFQYMQTLNMPTRNRELVNVTHKVACSTSILTKCFNQLLCSALDLRDEGKVTHMAMAHSDIIAEPFWLETLWGEMWLHAADLVSAVVPIKDQEGRTSTAIGLESDRWAVPTCIYSKDRSRLPDTFGPEACCDEGEVLLVNTGLFLADLRRPWWDDFAFTFTDRIVKRADGKREAECRSEDWEMSHHLAQHGARVMATWKIGLEHVGSYSYKHPVAAVEVKAEALAAIA